MANKNDVKKALEIIRKNGDMYEAIAKALNNNPTKMWLLRYNLLFFSRILYMGVLLKDQIVVHFAPVDKVHEAEEVIRKALGFKADIINNSFANILNPFLAFVKKDPYILYENASSKEEFCYNMNKLLTFCQFYNIKGIYLSEKDLTSLFPYINMSEYKICSRSEIFEIRNMKLGEDRFYKIGFNELIKLVKLLRNDAVEKNSITYFGSKINDEAIKQALENYEKDNNLTNLKAMVSARFSLALNSDSTYKTKDLRFVRSQT